MGDLGGLGGCGRRGRSHSERKSPGRLEEVAEQLAPAEGGVGGACLFKGQDTQVTEQLPNFN